MNTDKALDFPATNAASPEFIRVYPFLSVFIRDPKV
jgi:hypothetical protein